MIKLLMAICFVSLSNFIFCQEAYQQHRHLSYTEIDSITKSHYQKGSLDKAIPYFEAALGNAKSAFGEQDSMVALYTGNLGFFYKQLGQYHKALPLSIQSKDIYQKILGSEHPDFATSLNNLANLYLSMGQFDQALPLYIQSKDIYHKVLGSEHPHYSLALNNLAQLHQDMGNFDKALPLLIQSKDIYQNVLGSEHPLFAQSLNNLALLHQKMGNFNQALSLFVQSMEIEEKAGRKEHPHFGALANNLALLHSSMGNHALALPLYTQCIKIAKKTRGKEHPHVAASLNNLANLYLSMGMFDQALPLLIQSKDIYQKILGSGHPRFAQSLNSLATLQQSLGHFDKAWKMLSLAINSQSGLQLSHNFDDNWRDSLMHAPFPSNMHLEKVLNSLGIAYDVLKKDTAIIDADTKQAIVADVAHQLLIKVRNQVSNEKDKLRTLAQSNDWLLRSLDVLNFKTNNQKAFQRADENKSVLLLQATKSEAAYRLGELPDSLVWKDKQLQKKKSQLQAKILEKRVKNEKDSLRNELNQVSLHIDAFTKIIEKEYPKYHKLEYEQADAKAKDIQALLDDETALLEFVIADSVIHIFLVDKNSVKWVKSDVPKEKLNNNIKAMHQSLSNIKLLSKDTKMAYKNYTIKALWFYRQLIEPVLKDKSSIKNLIIVTDGELGHLPFETFLTEAASQAHTDYHRLKYLMDQYNISYNYSATLWKENKNAPSTQNNGQILGLAANYEIQLDASMIDVRLPTDQSLREGLIPLPAARREVEKLQEKYSGFFAFDTLASEKTVKQKASQYAILHFATHGILDAKRPVLSSLALSEDNDSTESNFLQAHEISKMELNADLVVLSACETGFGKFEQGNGIASLARSFMYAGAPALVVSLWQVNDLATSKIMQQLYENLAKGIPKDEALRLAKQQYMQSAQGIMAHPVFWSPFIMIGKTDPVYIKKKGGAMPWVLGGIVAVLVFGGGLALSRGKGRLNS